MGPSEDRTPTPGAPHGGRGEPGGDGTLLVVDGAVDVPGPLTRSSRVELVAGEVWSEGARFGGGGKELWALLRGDRYPSTTPPTVSALVAAYGRGAPVVGVHVSSQLSVTVARAREAVARIGVGRGPGAHVVDTGSLSVGAGLVALAVHEAVDRPADALAALARSVSSRLHTFALVQEVRALRHSDRASLVPQAHLVSSHPLVLAVRGRVVPLAQPRHRRHAVEALAGHVDATAGHRLGAWALGHGDAGDVDAVVERLSEQLGMPPRFATELGPTVGSHLGPDALVVAAVVGSIDGSIDG